MSGANNRFKVDNGLVASGNAIFYDRVDVQANAHFNNDLFVVSGNLVVNGSLVYANVTIGQGGIFLVADQQPLGNTSNRFNAFLYDTISYGTIRPNANGGALGTTTVKFLTQSIRSDRQSREPGSLQRAPRPFMDRTSS